MGTDNKSERELSTIVAFSGGLGFGAMLSVSEALHIGEREISFSLSIWTAIAFLIGFTPTFAYVRCVFGSGKQIPPIIRRGGPVVLVVMAVGAFAYPFRSQAIDKMGVRLAAMGVALCVVAAGLALIWRIVHAADREEEAQEANEQSSRPSQSESEDMP
jgi:hypothetical protein